MLFKILKLLGLDVPARIEAAKASLELRAEHVADRIKNVARETAVIAALSALAVAALAMAGGVGLIVLYRWTADAYGDYAGLGVVGGVLVAAAAVLALVIAFKARSFGARDAADDAVLERAAARATVAAPLSPDYPSAPPIAPTYPAASASDLMEPLAFLLSRSVRFPRFDSPVVDEFVGRLRKTAEGSADEVIDRAANVIRYGNRANLAFVLGGTAMLGWLLARNSPP
jgi:hypothetical protein